MRRYTLYLVLVCALPLLLCPLGAALEIVYTEPVNVAFTAVIVPAGGEGALPQSLEIDIPEGARAVDFQVGVDYKKPISFTSYYLGNDGKNTYWCDVNNDTFPDIIIGTYTQNFLYKNNGDGTFTKLDRFGTHYTQDINPCDYDGDGDLDFAVAAMDGPSYLYENTGEFEYTPHKLENHGTHAYSSIWMDIERDGDFDLILANGVCGDVSSTNNSYYINDGNGNFEMRYGLGSENSINCRGVHLNNDTYPDVILSNKGSIQFFLNTGEGTFEEMIIDREVQYNLTGNGYYCIWWWDHDGDSDRDILIKSGGEHYYFENINYTYHHNTSYDGYENFLLVDDGENEDLNCIHTDNGLVAVVEEDGVKKEIFVADYVDEDADISYADLENDGDLDIVIGEWSSAYLFVNEQYAHTTLNLTVDLNAFIDLNEGCAKALAGVDLGEDVTVSGIELVSLEWEWPQEDPDDPDDDEPDDPDDDEPDDPDDDEPDDPDDDEPDDPDDDEPDDPDDDEPDDPDDDEPDDDCDDDDDDDDDDCDDDDDDDDNNNGGDKDKKDKKKLTDMSTPEGKLVFTGLSMVLVTAVFVLALVLVLVQKKKHSRKQELEMMESEDRIIPDD